jgi:hypothetical protein
MAKANPIIGWNNLFERGTVVESSEATGYEAENAFDGLSYDSWKANASGAATLAVFCASSQEVDCWGFYGSDLYVQGGTIKLQYSDDGSNWSDIGTTITPTHGGAHLQKFSAASHPYWRVYVNSPTTASYFVHIFVGKALSFDRGILAGVFVPTMARTAEILDNVSEGGAFLGRSVIRRGAQISLAVRNMSETWTRSYWEPFLDYAEKRPFLICWDPGDHSDEVAFARTRGKAAPVEYNAATYMDHVLDLECLIEPPASQSSLVMSAPSAPTGVAAVPAYTGAGRITVSWNAVGGAATYNLYRATSSGGSFSLVQSGITGTSHTDTGMSNSTTYYFKVSAVNIASQEGSLSAEVNAKTPTVVHTFTGANNATDPGAADTGQSFTAITLVGLADGTLPGRINNELYAAVAGRAAQLNSGLADGTIRIELRNTLEAGNGLVFRFVDDNNFWYIRAVTDSQLEIVDVTSGSGSGVGSDPFDAPGNGDVIEIVLSDTSIIVKVAGVQVYSTTSAVRKTATKHGVLLGTTTQRMDNFGVV